MIDGILGLVLVEAVILSVWLARRGKGGAIGVLLAFLGSGAILLLALRTALAGGAGEPVFWGLLALSFPLHLAALFLGWRLIRT